MVVGNGRKPLPVRNPLDKSPRTENPLRKILQEATEYDNII